MGYLFFLVYFLVLIPTTAMSADLVLNHTFPANLWKAIMAETSGDIEAFGELPIASVALCVHNRYQSGLGHGLVAMQRKDLDRFVKRELAYLKSKTGKDYAPIAREIVKKVMNGEYPDMTGGATHYENIEKFGMPPWGRSMKKTCKIGSHTFFKERARHEQ